MSNNPVFKLKYLLWLVPVFVYLLGYVGMRVQIEKMKKDKVYLADSLRILRSQGLVLQGNYQELSAEDRITRVAKEELGLIHTNANGLKVTIDSAALQAIRLKVGEQYE